MKYIKKIPIIQLFFLKGQLISLLFLFLIFFISFNACSGNLFDGMDSGKSSNDAEELTRAGDARLLAKDNTGALDAYNRALAVNPLFADALRGRSSALLNIAAPSGSFGADFSKLIISQSEASTDLADSFSFSLTTWETLSTAISNAKDALDTIPATDRNSNDAMNISMLSMTKVMANIMVTKLKLEALGTTIEFNSDFSNLSDFVNFSVDCEDPANAANAACTTDKLTGDEALALLDDAIANGTSLTSSDFGTTLNTQLSTMRCELCWPDPQPVGYVQPSDCGTKPSTCN